MFKARKRNPKQKANLRRKDDDKDNENNGADHDDDDTDTADAIARIKKKRKLLTDIQFKKGTDAVSLLKGRTDEEPSLLEGDATASNTTTAANSSSQEGIMEQKHKQALEDYVEAKLADIVGEGSNGTTSQKGDTASNPTDGSNNNSNNQKLTKEELYKQLAQTSESMVGRSSTTGAEGGNNTDADGDVGTGGAMLVAGTGLAEVILPVNERLKAANKATQELAAAKSGGAGPVRNRNATYFGMPKTSTVPVPAGTSRFQVSAADKHRHFANNNNKNRQSSQQQQQGQQQDNKVEESPEDQGRMGFDAVRGKAAAPGSSNNNQNSNDSNRNNSNSNNQNQGKKNNRASDDKVYGRFIKHQRDNQRRGR